MRRRQPRSTLFPYTTLFRSQPQGGNVAAAKLVGELLAGKAKAQGIERVVFDRGGYMYHGRVKALADRKSTRLNSSHITTSYAVFCLKKKNVAKAMQTCKDLP